MKHEQPPIARREFLRGLGVCVALPALPSIARATAAAPAMATTATGAPLRMAFLYVPNGVNVDKWRPTGGGVDYQLGESLASLADFRKHLQFFSGLGHQNGTAGRDGAGDHARASASFLTGARPRKTSGADIHVGTSVDQLAAQHIGGQTRFPSLELSCDSARKSGSCDSGYACAYQYNLAWRSATLPVAAEKNPRLVFERLFGAGDGEARQAALAQRRNARKSILDFVTDDARRLARKAGKADRRKLDEYLTSVREVEQQVEHVEQFGDPKDPQLATPAGIPPAYRDHLRIMFDLLAVAFQTDSTRVATFLLAHDGSNRSFADIGVPDGHHHLSHHGRDEEKLRKIAEIDKFYVEQFAYFLNVMSEKQDVDGRPLLDNSMILYGSGLADGNAHGHHDLPIILAGKGGDTLTPGRYRQAPERTPMSNLYVSMLNRMGVAVDQFGDSDGKIDIG